MNQIAQQNGRKSERVCLVTPAHLAANPRLVKEANALVAAGYEVEVFSCEFMEWPLAGDEAILREVTWRSHVVRWRRARNPALFWKSRLRQHLFRRGWSLLQGVGGERWQSWVALRAYDRVLPELQARVIDCEADLYIGHNLQALPIVVTAAESQGGRVGFDAEDYHSGMYREHEMDSPARQMTKYLERRYLPRCDYLTAASPGIAKAYREKFGQRIPEPVSILNVFPLAQRPYRFRERRSGDNGLSLYWFSQTIGADRGLEDVVGAMGILGKPDVTLHLRGKWQAGYRDRLHQFAAEKGVGAEQIVAHPPAPADEMVRLAAEHDVGLALEPGRDVNNRLAVSNKLFTYFLAGNAVIATATEGQQAMMETAAGAGICYRTGDVEALVAHLRKWCESREALEAARRRAWEWGARRYNWDVEKRKLLQQIADVLKPSSTRKV